VNHHLHRTPFSIKHPHGLLLFRVLLNLKDLLVRIFFTRFLFPSIILFLAGKNSFAQSGLWTWMKGDSLPGSTAVYGTQGVPDAANTPGAMYEAYNWTDLDGKKHTDELDINSMNRQFYEAMKDVPFATVRAQASAARPPP
jgi:hypothetical protein